MSPSRKGPLRSPHPDRELRDPSLPRPLPLKSRYSRYSRSFFPNETFLHSLPNHSGLLGPPHRSPRRHHRRRRRHRRRPLRRRFSNHESYPRRHPRPHPPRPRVPLVPSTTPSRRPSLRWTPLCRSDTSLCFGTRRTNYGSDLSGDSGCGVGDEALVPGIVCVSDLNG